MLRPGTIVNYQTRTGHDSIYELILTVNPIKRGTQTISFCNSYTFNGKTYTETTVVIDTLHTAYGCDSVLTTILTKGQSFLRHDTATIVPGEILYWRGQEIKNQGLYQDKYISSTGCDSIYTLGVGLQEAAPQMNMRTWNEVICEGDTLDWRDKRYYNTGTYVDTIFVGATKTVDSLYVLNLTVNPIYAWSERITTHDFPFTYRGHEFTYDGEIYTIPYKSHLGCDSIITVYAARELSRTEDYETICYGDTYIWKWNGQTYQETGRYVMTIKDSQGRDSVEHLLNLTVKYIPETYVTKTICSGSSFTFGDQVLTQSGIYDYTFKSGSCDSLVHLSLNVLSVDTNRFVHHMNEGDSYDWNGLRLTQTGTYFNYGVNRFGCDSINVLELTVNKVDTIDSTATICPSTTLIWHGIHASQTGDYYAAEQQANGDYNYYRLHLTVMELVEVDKYFTICDDEAVIYNGKSYTNGGEFTDYLACDTLIRLHIQKHPQQVYETNASLGGEHGYTWTYMDGGVEKTNTFTTPGTYEFESNSPTTGCSELWRLILVENLQSYNFEETVTICEGEPFNWHGMTNLSHQYIGQTHDYTAEYKTRTGQDSIYTLHLTVTPIKRAYKTIVFCGEVDWNGVRYNHSAVVNDTLTSSTGCDSIVRVSLDKATPFYSYESRDLPQGEVLHWHGFDIFSDGVYRDVQTTTSGCDSIYELKVTIIPATPQTNQYATELSTCEGDTIIWRGKNIWSGGTYVDTVWTAGHDKVDSIFTLRFTVWPAPKDTIYRHLYTCGQGATIDYQGKTYTDNDTVISNLHTIHGCDSIVKVYLHFNTALYLSDTVKIPDTELPYTWNYRLSGTARDTVLTTAGTYLHAEAAEGSCRNREELVLIVYPTYLFEHDTTICQTALPFFWTTGPQDHASDELQHAIGTTKQYEYRYTTVNGTDSIYRLHLTIDPAPVKTEYYYVCSGTPQDIRGKTYGNGIDETDRVYRDTVTASDPNGQCDSIIYVEVYVSSLKKYTETQILHVNETIQWHNYTIVQGGDYTDTVKTANGCDSISVMHIVQETRKHERVCELEIPYTWDKDGKQYSSTGIWDYTEFDQTTGNIIGYYTLYLTVDTVPTVVEQYFVCAGYPEIIYNKTYGSILDTQDTVYRDTTTRMSPTSCDTTVYVEIHVSSVKQHTQTVLLHYGETLDWNGLHITQGGDYSDTTQIGAGCDSISYLHVIEERRHNETVCELDLPFHWDRNNQDYNTAGIKTDTVFDQYGNIAEFYSLYLTIDTVPTRVEQHYVCYGHPQTINGTEYGGLGSTPDTLYRDTIPDRPSPSACDSVIYLEIFVSSETVDEKTVILHEGETYTWFGKEISELSTKTYDTITYDAVTGCEITHYLHVVAEHRDIITICSLDTADFTWSFNGQKYNTTGIYTDTVFDPVTGYISQFHTLDLTVKIPVDTTIYLNGCIDKGGVTFLDKVYLNDTTILIASFLPSSFSSLIFFA